MGNRKSSDRFSSANRKISKPVGNPQRKAPGILSKMPVKKITRTSIEKEVDDENMER